MKRAIKCNANSSDGGNTFLFRRRYAEVEMRRQKTKKYLYDGRNGGSGLSENERRIYIGNSLGCYGLLG